MDFLKSPLWRIVIGLVLGIVVGIVVPHTAEILGAPVKDILAYFGDMFINALKMIIVPLILATIVVGVSKMATQDSFGRIGGKTVGFYVVTGFISIVTGLILVNAIAPGEIDSAQALVDSLDVEEMQEEYETKVSAKIEGKSAKDIFDIVLRAIPSNVFVAASETQLLALVFVGVIFGIAMPRLPGPLQETMSNFWQGLHDIMITITNWIMLFAPIGVFALVGKVVMVAGWEAFLDLKWFVLTVVLALVIHFFVWLPLLLRFVGGIAPYRYFSKVVRAQMTAFATASSSATLPVSIDSAKRAGVSDRVTSFVLPLGATVNMDGTAMYECVVVIFIAQIYAYTQGIEISIAQQFIVVLLALATSIGVAGIPAASLVAIALILPVVGLPIEWIGIILAVDRILDMCRTATNVTSDLTITAIVASGEGEELSDLRAA